jgi:hypothetical protein
VYAARDGKRYRPSMFLTLTCDSYGTVNGDGTPADPASYDYTRAARDAIHFAALFDRFIQNLRRVLGYEAQYFGGVEPQKRLAPHLHLAVRGSVPRPLLRQSWPPRITRSGGQPPSKSGSLETSCRSGMKVLTTTSTRPPGMSCRPGMRHLTPSVLRTSPGMWPDSGPGSTPRGCSPGPRTPTGVSAM